MRFYGGAFNNRFSGIVAAAISKFSVAVTLNSGSVISALANFSARIE